MNEKKNERATENAPPQWLRNYLFCDSSGYRIIYIPCMHLYCAAVFVLSVRVYECKCAEICYISHILLQQSPRFAYIHVHLNYMKKKKRILFLLRIFINESCMYRISWKCWTQHNFWEPFGVFLFYHKNHLKYLVERLTYERFCCCCLRFDRWKLDPMN